MAADTVPKAAFGISITWGGHDMGYMKNVDGPDESVDVIDVTTHDSSGHRNFVAGLHDGGELALELEYIPGATTGQKIFRDDLKSRTYRQVVMTFADATTITFDAIPTGWKINNDYDKSRTCSIKMKLTGDATYA